MTVLSAWVLSQIERLYTIPLLLHPVDFRSDNFESLYPAFNMLIVNCLFLISIITIELLVS